MVIGCHRVEEPNTVRAAVFQIREARIERLGIEVDRHLRITRGEDRLLEGQFFRVVASNGPIVTIVRDRHNRVGGIEISHPRRQPGREPRL